MMFFKPKYAGKMPYGAFELKVAYQDNMLLAALITAAAVGVVWLSIYIYQEANRVELENIPTMVIESVMDLGPPPTIVKKPPQIEISKQKIAQPKVGIPKPVADDEVTEDVVLATKEELADINVSDLDFGSDGDINVEIREEILPQSGAFVAYEFAPKFIEKVKPIYPRLAQQAGIEGVVFVSVLVDKNGTVRDAKIAKSSGTNAGLEEAALEAALKCKFSPALQNGRPIAVWATFDFRFKIRDAG
jgi:periplasmic protein TonB